ADTGASVAPAVMDIVAAAARSLQGHLMVLVVLYGVPLALAAVGGIRALKRSAGEAAPVDRLAILTCLVLPNLICAVALFTALAVETGPDESLYRLHMRYYSFALPLLYIAAASFVSQKAHGSTPATPPVRIALVL